MTRKDYQLIASTIKELTKGLESEDYLEHYVPVIRELANNLADRLEIENPRFNRVKFWEACGL